MKQLKTYGGILLKMDKNDYCKCEHPVLTAVEDDWGFWDVCTRCGKRIEDGYHYFNHYDGEDHVDIDNE